MSVASSGVTSASVLIVMQSTISSCPVAKCYNANARQQLPVGGNRISDTGAAVCDTSVDLAGLATTRAVAVLVQDDVVESVAEQLGLADQVRVAAVAGRRVDGRARDGGE